MIPTSIIRIWFLGLFSWILLGLGIYLSHKWYQHAWSYDFNLQRSYFDPHIGNNHETRLLIIAACLLFGFRRRANRPGYPQLIDER